MFGLGFNAQAEGTAQGHGEAPAGLGDGAPHWSYSGEGGPGTWGTMSSEFAACATGHNQSPIDIADAETAEMKRLQLSYKVTPLELLNNGHTIQATYQPGSTLHVGNKAYALAQFHFHTPSEHLVRGAPAAMEIHFVHKDAAGAIAVIGVLVTEGTHNMAAEELIAQLPGRGGETVKAASTLINARDLMPDGMDYFRYMGSLTTPPCTEGVNWFVLKEPISMSAEQISRLTAVMGQNARPAQPRNGRLLLDATSTR
ncbi:MAG: hypothetical protein A2516_11875 [Alphaproteobacteria bacterium RIFOXYD12_FULL_60_8]|nr:MAG: hypothetical protein A2516_11875 [Alphaproteobacteria bacterium RIFOXYD12_FULL_60_8]